MTAMFFGWGDGMSAVQDYFLRSDNDDRRKFLTAYGTFAAVTPPQTVLLVSVSVTSCVIAHVEKVEARLAQRAVTEKGAQQFA
jgi:hypothetical protein